MTALTSFLLSIGMAFTMAQTEKKADAINLEMRVYRVTTSITGNGLTSQTLSGLPGSFQILHEKWGDVEVSMEGSELTWNGKTSPDHSRIINIGRPNILVREGDQAKVIISDPVQYFQPEPNGMYSLNHDASAGLSVEVRPKAVGANEEATLSLLLKFHAAFVESRESIPDVSLNVGKPIFENVSVEGRIGSYYDQWVGYRINIPSQGYVYLFVKPSKYSEK